MAQLPKENGTECAKLAGLEEYLHPDGITVIEWAERWFGKVTFIETGPRGIQASNDDEKSEHGTPPLGFRFVHIEPLSETDRRITYEDSGA